MNMIHSIGEMVDVKIINAFVTPGSNGFVGGNPAGVVLDADDLNDEQMLSIASQVGLSETVFVSKSAISDFKFDFFTPNRRIAHCGHATIAAFSYLAKIGRIGEGETSKETVDGPRNIYIRDGAAYMEQLTPEVHRSGEWDSRSVTEDAVLAALGLIDSDLDNRFPIVRAFNGNACLLVSVKSASVLRKVRADLDAIEKISDALDLIGFYVFTTEASEPTVDATTRMFAPRFGIKEESATGMMAGPLGYLLNRHGDDVKKTYTIEQGAFMSPSSPSVLNVELTGDADTVDSVIVGGLGAVRSDMRVSP